MSVREEVRRALCPEAEVDKAFELLEHIANRDGWGRAQAHTASNLCISGRELQIMDRLADAGFVQRSTYHHQPTYKLTGCGLLYIKPVMQQAHNRLEPSD